MSADGGHQERAEDDLGTTEGGESQPQEEDKLEDKVEREPVDDTDEALDDGEEGENDPVSQPLSIVSCGVSKEGGKRVVAGDDEASEVGEELATEVKDDEEEVEGGDTNGGIGLGNASLLLQVGDGRVLGELSVENAEVVLRSFLGRRHFRDKISCVRRGW